MKMSQKSTKKLICFYQKELIENKKKLQKSSILLIDLTSWQNKTALKLNNYKEDYRTNPKYCLLNPTKSQLGKTSKQILQKSSKTLRSKLSLNQ